MSRGPQTFRQNDLKRALKVAAGAGMRVTEIRVDKDGARIVVVSEPGKVAASEANEWDRF
jgi:hypothetical protein